MQDSGPVSRTTCHTDIIAMQTRADSDVRLSISGFVNWNR